MANSVKLKSKYQKPGCVVRINPEAMRVLDKLERGTGQTKSYIVSQLIIQGSQFIELFPEDCAECAFAGDCDNVHCAKKEADT